MRRRRHTHRDDRGLTLPRVVRHRRKPATRLRSKRHRDWLATLPCAFCGIHGTRPPVEAAHLREGTDGGTGIKPSDIFCWPADRNCHRQQHAVGEPAFFDANGVPDPVRLTLSYARRSPCPRTRIAGEAEYARRY